MSDRDIQGVEGKDQQKERESHEKREERVKTARYRAEITADISLVFNTPEPEKCICLYLQDTTFVEATKICYLSQTFSQKLVSRHREDI